MTSHEALFSRRRCRLYRPKSSVVFMTIPPPKKTMLHLIGNIPFWADPVVHLLLLKSSIDKLKAVFVAKFIQSGHTDDS